MHPQLALVGELQAPRQVAAWAANAFGDRIELATLAREERDDAVGLAELSSA
jgi:hypothetical protein